MKKVRLKQGTLEWEKFRNTRIGSSEVFDIVRYYASEDELQNCGFNAEDFKAEKPYTTAWALYHKLLGDGMFRRGELEAEFAEYGHAVEPYGARILQRERTNKVKAGEVYADERLIASLDVSGIAEDIDAAVPFDFGIGYPQAGQKFVCEQKTMLPQMIKRGMPYKYIVQAQYQIMETKADFFILQVMILRDDTPFIRGKICQMPPRKRYEYLDENMTVRHYYFKNNPHLSRLIEVCLDRLFADVEEQREPEPYLRCDSQQNIIESIRLNTLYNDEYVKDYDLSAYVKAKNAEKAAENKRKSELQKIIETAKAENVCRFRSPDGTSAFFSSNGRFLEKEGVNTN